MNRQYIRKNITTVAILLFIVLFCITQLAEPAFLYEKDGSLRQFGLGKINIYFSYFLLFIGFILFNVSKIYTIIY